MRFYSGWLIYTIVFFCRNAAIADIKDLSADKFRERMQEPLERISDYIGFADSLASLCPNKVRSRFLNKSKDGGEKEARFVQNGYINYFFALCRVLW